MAIRRKKNQRRQVKQSEPLYIDFREVGKLIAVSVIVIIGVWATKQIDDIPIKTIEIQSSLEKVNKAEIKTIAQNYMHSGFFTVDLTSFENQLNDIPWVYRASIKRQWPNKVVIDIVEQEPYFRWGKQHLINKYAQIFYVDNLNDYLHLPLLEGVLGREKAIIDLYYRYQEGFEQVGTRIVSLKEDARYDKEILLADGILINVGREQTEQQIRRCLHSLAMFTKSEREAIASIDLRHSNGFAVRWNT